jgi:N-acetylglucosaminyldiphosphoundecaprenol N-acetyl-beta-D-mannosaminyltransferase
MIPPFKKVNILGVNVDVASVDRAAEHLVNSAKEHTRGYVCVTSVHGIVEAQENQPFRDILNDATMVTSDGVPLVWFGRIKGHADMQRVYGPDLMLDIMKRTQDGALTHFFYGGNTGVAEELKASMENRFPGVVVCGTYCPPFRPLTDGEASDLIAQVDALKPDFFWVGLSTPKQETFMSAYRERLATRVMLGVGAAFDFHSGHLQQAPAILQKAGLEWAYRLYREPKRLWRRYLKNNPIFLWGVFRQLTGLKRYPPS